MQIADLRQRLRALGALPVHEARVLRQWVQALAADSGRSKPEHFLPQALLGCLGVLACYAIALQFSLCTSKGCLLLGKRGTRALGG